MAEYIVLGKPSKTLSAFGSIMALKVYPNEIAPLSNRWLSVVFRHFVKQSIPRLVKMQHLCNGGSMLRFNVGKHCNSTLETPMFC